MKVLVTGGGGREHALVKMIAKSELVEKVFCAPGNAGTALIGVNVDLKPDDIPGLIAFAKEHEISFTVVGPEDPLVKGVVDAFQAEGLAIIGPTQAAAALEGSKLFTKKLCMENGIPTAEYKVFTEVNTPDGFTALEDHVFAKALPFVIKVDKLAAGKGALVCKTKIDVDNALNRIKLGEFKEAAYTVIVEDFLVGEEASFIVLVDPNGNVLPLASSQDHKAACDGDTGPNTGGMGAYTPAPVVTDTVTKRVMDRIIHPTIEAMARAGTPFTGVLYAGLMIDEDGNPFLVEYNVRFGDPEIQPILMRMKSDIVPIFQALLKGKLDEVSIEWDPRPAMFVVACSLGYPGKYQSGYEVMGLDKVEMAGGHVIHAGTQLVDGIVKTSGGRALGVGALGDTFAKAQKNVYTAIDNLAFHNLTLRHDIGHRAVAREAGA